MPFSYRRQWRNKTAEMTVHLDRSVKLRSTPITMLPRFPAAMLGASLLDLIQSSGDGVLVVDAARQIVLVNQRAERIFGYPANFLLDKSLDMLLPPNMPGEPRRRLDRLGAARTSGRRSRLELRIKRADGSPLTLKASVARLTIHGDIYLALTLHEAYPMHVFEPSSAPVPPHARRRAMTNQQASEVEKRRFSRKLYDDIGQRLSVLKLDLSWLENRLPDANQVVPARLAEMQGLLDNVITLTKSMASTLRPPVLDDFGLLAAVEWMAESFRKRTGISCELECEGTGEKLDDALESAVFRVIQEGLANVERHSHAGQVWISIRQHVRELEIEIRDDGVGFESGSQAKPGCYGLVAMQERVFILGGTIRIENTRPHGVQILACIPLESGPSMDLVLNSPLSTHDTNRNRR